MEENASDALHIRLKVFMDSTGLNNSQFADKCGVPRPSFSQIITGRNKKVSDIMLTQIHNAFPELNMMWLIFGEGKMVDADSGNGAISIGSADIVSSGYPAADDLSFAHFPDDSMGGEFSKFAHEDTIIRKNGQEITPISGVVPAGGIDSEGLSSAIAAKISTGLREELHKPMRKVVRITVFYDDNSYETFIPSSEKGG